ncbi:Hypothetical protein CINCED_3A008479 [Cinara cedri]|uniref:Uncharacterized protein n=1 Tax=Cinara cedri TaxID=506608 RepID=A0A5E4M1T7_9HEMI|nr:Hypothetical protein CINCED_3A008479 [Cinara cedri]
MVSRSVSNDLLYSLLKEVIEAVKHSGRMGLGYTTAGTGITSSAPDSLTCHG